MWMIVCLAGCFAIAILFAHAASEIDRREARWRQMHPPDGMREERFDGKDQERLVHVGDVGAHKFIFPWQERAHISLHGDAHRVRDIDLHVISHEGLFAQRAEDSLRPAPVDLFPRPDFVKPRNALDDLSPHTFFYLPAAFFFLLFLCLYWLAAAFFPLFFGIYCLPDAFFPLSLKTASGAIPDAA